MYPKYYDCGNPSGCTHLDYCADPINTKIDWTNDWSLDNWVGRFNLQCTEPYLLGLLGTMFFTGIVTSGLIFSRLGDIYGRKWLTRISSLASIPLQLGFIVSQSYHLNIILFLLLGFTWPGKN